MKRVSIVLLLLVSLGNTVKVFAQVVLPQIIRDSMVLQRDAKVNVWGWASANEKVTVSFNKKKI